MRVVVKLRSFVEEGESLCQNQRALTSLGSIARGKKDQPTIFHHRLSLFRPQSLSSEKLKEGSSNQRENKIKEHTSDQPDPEYSKKFRVSTFLNCIKLSNGRIWSLSNYVKCPVRQRSRERRIEHTQADTDKTHLHATNYHYSIQTHDTQESATHDRRSPQTSRADPDQTIQNFRASKY